MTDHLLTIVTFLPLLGAAILLFVRDRDDAGKDLARWVALIVSGLTFILSLWMWAQFDNSNAGFQFVENYEWIGTSIGYRMGVDGVSVLFVVLTALLTPVVVISSWGSIQSRVRDYMLVFLILETLCIGVFTALDLAMFYVFFEGSLIPMFLIIGIWGGKRRIQAAYKFFFYTFTGSVLMLLAIMAMYWQAGTLDIRKLLAFHFDPRLQFWLWLAFFASFAVKMPMWPFHRWLPEAHVEAPTAGSVILAGVLLKMGTYGFVRFNLSLFPQASIQMAPWIAALAVIGILYGAAVSYAQKDAKKLVAYSSVSHLGFVMLGLFALNPQGIQGGILQMINHGLSTGALFLLVGVIYERRHTREMDAFGGLWKIMPVYAALTLIVTLSSMGLPGLNGFVGEFTILLGAFGSQAIGSPWFAGLAAIGVILAAVYLLFMFQKLFLGPADKEENRVLLDLNWREIVTLVPLLVFIFWIGLYPTPFFNLMAPSVDKLVAALQSAAVAGLP